MAGGDNVLWMSVVLHYGSGAAFAVGLGDGYVRDRGRAWQRRQELEPQIDFMKVGIVDGHRIRKE